MKLQLTIASLLLALTPVSLLQAQGSAKAIENDWEIVKKITRVKRVLNKGEPKVDYNKNTLKFSRSTKIKMMEDQTLNLQVFSAYFQPQIIIYDTKGKMLEHSKHLTPRNTKLENGKKAILRATDIEFYPPDRGIYTVVVTTEKVSQGPYWIQGTIWRPKTKAADAKTITQSSLKPSEPFGGVKKSKYDESYSYRREYNDPSILNTFGRPAKQMSFTVSWVQTGGKRKPSPGPALDAGNIEAIRDNVIYRKPIMNIKTGALLRLQATIFDPNKEIRVNVDVEGPYAKLLPELVAQAKKKMVEFSTRARSRK